MVDQRADQAVESEDATRVSVFIPLERMGEFKRALEVMRASARRLDLPPWQVEVGDCEWRPVRVYGETSDGRPLQQTLQLEGRPTTIIGTAPVLSGWQFLAKIEHNDSGNLVKLMGQDKDASAEWHSCSPECGHCDLSRQRSTTYMVRNVDSKEIKQVGSTCVSDFLGGQYRDPERIAAMYDHLMMIEREFMHDPDREPGGVSTGAFGVEPERLMAAVLKIAQEDGGYLSAEKAETLGCIGTGDRLRAAFWSKRPIEVSPSATHTAMAREVVEFLKGQKQAESVWLRNIAYLAERPCIGCKDVGLFASGYVAWTRDLQKRGRGESGAGEWIGEKGQKVGTSATLERQAGFETSYGFKHVLSFRDESGNVLVWKTQSPPLGLVVGVSYHLKGTVKEHESYHGECQTEIIRAKVSELELFSFGAELAYAKIAAMAAPDRMDDRGHTPLLKAIWENKTAHAAILLKNGADPNQLNQDEIPVLSYAASAQMAELLISNGARAGDVEEEWLKSMDRSALEVLRAVGILGLAIVEVRQDTVQQGLFFGKVVNVGNGIVCQKVNRDGDTVLHDARTLSRTVSEGESVEISYSGGIGRVGGREPELERSR